MVFYLYLKRLKLSISPSLHHRQTNKTTHQNILKSIPDPVCHDELTMHTYSVCVMRKSDELMKHTATAVY